MKSLGFVITVAFGLCLVILAPQTLFAQVPECPKCFSGDCLFAAPGHSGACACEQVSQGLCAQCGNCEGGTGRCIFCPRKCALCFPGGVGNPVPPASTTRATDARVSPEWMKFSKLQTDVRPHSESLFRVVEAAQMHLDKFMRTDADCVTEFMRGSMRVPPGAEKTDPGVQVIDFMIERLNNVWTFVIEGPPLKEDLARGGDVAVNLELDTNTGHWQLHSGWSPTVNGQPQPGLPIKQKSLLAEGNYR